MPRIAASVPAADESVQPATESQPEGTMGAGSVRAELLLAVVLLAVLLAYAPGLDGPFLWDDLALLQHPMVQQLHAPQAYLRAPFWDLHADEQGVGLFYRPLVVFSLALDRALHGENPVGFHGTNLALALANVGLVFTLARRHGASAAAAAWAALLFGWAPRLAESVAWVSGRTDLLATAAALGAFYCWRPNGVAQRLGAAVCLFAALMSKEAGVAAAVALVLCELGELWDAPRKRLGPIVGLVAVGIAVSTYLLFRAGSVGSAPDTIQLSAWERALTVGEAVGRYAMMVLVPWTPETQIGVLGEPAVPFAVLGLLVAVAGVPLARRLFTARRLPLQLALFALGSLGLVLHVVPLPWLAVCGDRLLYGPLACAAVLCAPAVDWLTARSRWGWAAPAVLAASLLWPLERRVAQWADEATFWVEAVRTTPAGNCGPESAVANLYMRTHLCAELAQLDELLTPRERGRQPCEVREQHAACLAWQGDYAAAQALRLQGAGSTAGKAKQLVDLARGEMLLGRRARARELAGEALALSPAYRLPRDFLAALDRSDALSAKPSRTELEEAQLATLLGRRPEAERRWLALLASRRLEPEPEGAALAFLFVQGATDSAVSAAKLYRERHETEAPIVAVLEKRLALERALRAAQPVLLEALRRKAQ